MVLRECCSIRAAQVSQRPITFDSSFPHSIYRSAYSGPACFKKFTRGRLRNMYQFLGNSRTLSRLTWVNFSCIRPILLLCGIVIGTGGFLKICTLLLDLARSSFLLLSSPIFSGKFSSRIRLFSPRDFLQLVHSILALIRDGAIISGCKKAVRENARKWFENSWKSQTSDK